jgi:hypothetical protein
VCIKADENAMKAALRLFSVAVVGRCPFANYHGTTKDSEVSDAGLRPEKQFVRGIRLLSVIVAQASDW